ncbi:hypothetical protein P8452_51381 [Trifolium repens]|nr:hypothetical protein P8452_51381 [Trifolium repens]
MIGAAAVEQHNHDEFYNKVGGGPWLNEIDKFYKKIKDLKNTAIAYSLKEKRRWMEGLKKEMAMKEKKKVDGEFSNFSQRRERLLLYPPLLTYLATAMNEQMTHITAPTAYGAEVDGLNELCSYKRDTQ